MISLEMISSHMKSSSAGVDFGQDDFILLKSSPAEDDFVGDDFISCEIIFCGRWFRSRWNHLGEIISGRRWFHERWNHLLHMISDDFFGHHFGSISGVLLGSKTIHKVVPKWAPGRDPQFSISLAFQRQIRDSWVPFRAHFWVRFGVSLGSIFGFFSVTFIGTLSGEALRSHFVSILAQFSTNLLANFHEIGIWTKNTWHTAISLFHESWPTSSSKIVPKPIQHRFQLMPRPCHNLGSM